VLDNRGDQAYQSAGYSVGYWSSFFRCFSVSHSISCRVAASKSLKLTGSVTELWHVACHSRSIMPHASAFILIPHPHPHPPPSMRFSLTSRYAFAPDRSRAILLNGQQLHVCWWRWCCLKGQAEFDISVRKPLNALHVCMMIGLWAGWVYSWAGGGSFGVHQCGFGLALVDFFWFIAASMSQRALCFLARPWSCARLVGCRATLRHCG